MELKVAKKDRNFGNARFARNVFENAIQKQANRLAGTTDATKEQLQELTLEDIRAGFDADKPMKK